MDLMRPYRQLRITLVWDILSNPNAVPGWPQCRAPNSLPTHPSDSSDGFDLCTPADVIGEGTYVVPLLLMHEFPPVALLPCAIGRFLSSPGCPPLSALSVV